MLSFAFLLSVAIQAATAQPDASAEELGSPCGGELGDCPSLTCIPASVDCIDFLSCPGTCQDVDPSSPVLDEQQQQQSPRGHLQRVYTRCGGWGAYDDCDERIEQCAADPRNHGCGPSCDGPGLCIPAADRCGGDAETGCDVEKGMACFVQSAINRRCDENNRNQEGYLCEGWCLPLRFGSDSYSKSSMWEVVRTDQDGIQRNEVEEDNDGLPDDVDG